jgi:hypothetical protein
MRYYLSFLAVGLLAVSFTTPLRADDKDQARAVVDKAIKAAGGEEKLAKFNSRTWVAKGTYYGMGGDGVPYTANYAVSLPDKFRFEVEGFMTMVVDGDKGWIQAMGETREMNKDELAQQKEEMYVSTVTTLTPIKGGEYKLSLLGEAKVADRPAVGVKVSHKDHQDVNLYFDKDSGLLVKMEHKTKAQEEGNKEVTQEDIYSDHQDVQGAKLPRKATILRDGKKYVEGEASDVKAVDKHDDKTFAKP